LIIDVLQTGLVYFVYIDAHFVSVLSACIFIVCCAFDKVL